MTRRAALGRLARLAAAPGAHAATLAQVGSFSYALRRHHRVAVRVRVRATDAAGNTATRSVRVRVLR